MAGTSLDKPGHDSHRARRDRNAVSFNTVILWRHNVATCDEEADMRQTSGRTWHPAPHGRILACALIAAAVLFADAKVAFAQFEDMPPRDVYRERGRSRGGDKIALCFNGAAMMAPFEIRARA